MVKFTHMFVLSILIFWLSVSGCVGNDTSEVEEAGIVPHVTGTEENTSAGQELTEIDILEFEENITELEDLLENSSIGKEIVVEEL